MGLLKGVNIFIMRRKWRSINKHNRTNLVNRVEFSKIKVGIGTYGDINALFHNDNYKLIIGNYCSIAGGVTFIPESDHDINMVSTYPWKAMMLGVPEAVSKGDIIVEDDVWIGYSATILSGVHIGQGAVVAAGAVVSQNVPPYAVVGGVPAKVIKYRFSPEVIEKMMKIDYSKFDNNMINMNMERLYKAIDENYKYDWLPQKE